MFENHNRFVAGTPLLHDYLMHLGYELEDIETSSKLGASHTRPIKTYKLKNKIVIDAYKWVQLATDVNGKPNKEYQGYTVSKDLLTFFSQRQIEEVKNENDL